MPVVNTLTSNTAMTISELRGILGGNWVGDHERVASREVRGVALDSREVSAGWIFFAAKGEKEDGHRYVADAASRGALAAVVEREVPGSGIAQLVVKDSRAASARGAAIFYGRPSEKMPVIGVTGTNGKTTVTYLIRAIFTEAGKRLGLLGTVEYDLLSRTVRAKNTTPDGVMLQRQLAEMLEAGASGAVMEVSSHALSQGRVREVEFAAGVFTNLGRDHLDYHGTIESYREAKGELFRMLKPEAFAVLNADDDASKSFSRVTKATVCLYGLERGELTARIKDLSLSGSRCELVWGGKVFPLETPLVGLWNVRNVLAAGRTCLEMGSKVEHLRNAARVFKGVPGRLEKVEGADGFQVFVDYAHTPDALEAVLSSLRPLVSGRLIVVFGCGGDRDRGKRPVMGAVAERWADLFWLTADNSRSEKTEAIIEEIEQGLRRKDSYEVEPDRASAINAAIKAAGDGDAVVIAGKGHEDYQIMGNQTFHFDDREVARQALRRKAGA